MKIILLAAMTVDGYIAKHIEHRSFDWTSIEDKQFYVSKIKESKAVVMGSNSFKTFTKYPKGLHFVVYTSKPEALQNPKPEVITFEATKEDPRALVARLEAQGFTQLAVTGGASIYTMFMEAGLIDTLFLTVEPVLFGEGVKLFSKTIETKLKLEEIHHLTDQTKVLEYTVIK